VASKSRDWLGIALALCAAAVCVRLGVWQLSRLHQRRARNARIAAAVALPPLELTSAVRFDSVQNRRVQLHGVYDFAHERLWRPRSFEEQPGADLVTPLVLSGGTAVLVDRGWVPSPDGYHVNQALYLEADTTQLIGLAVRAPRDLGDVDPARLRDSLPYPLLPFTVQALPVEGVPVLPGDPIRWPVPALTDGPHLSYTIQWFSFATIILVGSAFLLRQRRRDARSATPLPNRPAVH